MSDNKVIFHIDEIIKWNLLLKNVSNLLNAVDKDKVYVEVLANSEAVKYYAINQDLGANLNIMESLTERGVEFVACNNALLAYDIEKCNIVPFIKVVPVGVLELMRKQSEGYAYIKP